MMADWNMFFAPGTRVLALPSWQRPRFYLPMERPLHRWEQSALYPASSLKARLYRLSLRLRAAARIAEVRTVHSSGWPLAEFIQDVLPDLASVVVLKGTPGPAQHITVKLHDEKGQVLGYLKYAEKDAARKRLRNEHFMLSNLPNGIGPRVLKFGPLGDGVALLKRALPGRLLTATQQPPADVLCLLDKLVILPPVPLETHPWVRRMRTPGVPHLDACFEPLAGRSWPVVVQHGDFAPWNILRSPDGSLTTLDWEYGELEGFPHLDLAYYILQVSALIYRRAPQEATQYTVDYLSKQPRLGLSRAEAQALACLAAYDAYRKSLEDGQSAVDVETKLQAWRRTIWEGAICGS